MTALPPTYYLHVWWARRPLVASRAAVLASLLPEDADRDKVMHILGIHGDPIAAKLRIDAAKRTGENLGPNVYGYKRAFVYSPDNDEKEWVRSEGFKIGLNNPIVLDPTAGGGSIPFESSRLGIETYANELNPVGATILKQTIEAPLLRAEDILEKYRQIAQKFAERVEQKLSGIFPEEESDDIDRSRRVAVCHP